MRDPRINSVYYHGVKSVSLHGRLEHVPHSTDSIQVAVDDMAAMAGNMI